jgi:ABC-type spermidine/putrescine transport system permease subunit I
MSTLSERGPAEAHAPREQAQEVRIRNSLRIQRLFFLGLLAPASLFIFVFLVIPLAWLFSLSFYENGSFTAKHYARMIYDPAYIKSIWITLEIAVTVTGLSILIGYPLAYMLAQLKRFWALLCLSLVLIPFWTSLLVRTYAWLVLLQNKGVVNNFLIDFGLIGERLYLMHNATGTTIGMLHIMLPFMVLPLYSSMTSIDPDLVRAARSLGAGPTYAFWQVFFPLSLPGCLAGALLIFILSIGFYITPAILGGGRTIMIAMLIDRNINLFFEWGAASSIAVVCLALVTLLFWVASKLFSLERLFGVHS